jgi:hypothetical protein
MTENKDFRTKLQQISDGTYVEPEVEETVDMKLTRMCIEAAENRKYEFHIVLYNNGANDRSFFYFKKHEIWNWCYSNNIDIETDKDTHPSDDKVLIISWRKTDNTN